MSSRRTLPLASALMGIVLTATACSGGDSGGDDTATQDEAFSPEKVDFVVHTSPGGGSDLFARQVSELLTSEDLAERWLVRNENGGSGASAMAFLRGLEGQDDTIAVSTPTWLTTPLTNAEAAVTIDQLTPIAQMVTEPTIMAVKADAPYESIEDFIAAAKSDPGGLVQTGGSVTAIDAIAGEIIQKEAGVEWQYLSFEGGGERIAAVLGGDADMIFAAPAEISEQVRAGDLKVIATIGEEPSALFPDAPTLSEAGLEQPVPQQLRGIVGPPEMPEQAVEYYASTLEELTKTEAWATYAEENGLTTVFQDSEEWGATLEEQNTLLETTLGELDLLAK